MSWKRSWVGLRERYVICIKWSSFINNFYIIIGKLCKLLFII